MPTGPNPLSSSTVFEPPFESVARRSSEEVIQRLTTTGALQPGVVCAKGLWLGRSGCVCVPDGAGADEAAKGPDGKGVELSVLEVIWSGGRAQRPHRPPLSVEPPGKGSSLFHSLTRYHVPSAWQGSSRAWD